MATSKITRVKEAAMQNAQALYEAVPESAQWDLFDALLWARNTLAAKEGAGHVFEVSPTRDGAVVCTFSKLEWAGEHSSQPMETGSEAVVMAVCEYLSGV